MGISRMPTAKPMAVSRTAAARMMVVEISTVVFSSPRLDQLFEITKQPGTLFTISGERVAEPRRCEEGAELVLVPPTKFSNPGHFVPVYLFVAGFGDNKGFPHAHRALGSPNLSTSTAVRSPPA